MANDTILKVENLKKYFTVTKRMILYRKTIGKVHAVDDISFEVRQGETFGIVVTE